VSALPRDLGHGLTLRSARRDDEAQLVEFNATMHADVEMPRADLADWTRDLFDTPHPTFEVDRDVTVVEDTDSGKIVSAAFLVPQVWSYAGVPIRAGQPELIATHPDFRRRGLIRTQLAVLHDLGRADAQVWQLISGIPGYYRQFGYTYAIDMPARPIVWLGQTARPPSTEFTLRAATADDVAALAGLEAEAASGTTLAPLRGSDGFTLELARRPGSVFRHEILVIEPATAASPSPCGFIAHERRLVDGVVSLRAFELLRGLSWLGPTAAVIAHLDNWVRGHPDGRGRGVRFALPVQHPAIRSAYTRLGWGRPGTYGLYVRIADVAAFVRAVAPALEARLAASPAAAWTGDLKIDLYQDGLRLRFDAGRLTAIEPWSAPTDGGETRADASVPRGDFLHLLFGNRTIYELERATADCLVATDAGALLLDVLFPPMAASTWEYC
jgi:GNAT superfamily N-acetyltransferase